MQTELQFSIIYPSHTENDINKFDFFIRMMPADDKNIVSVVSVPKFEIDGRVVKHINFSIQSERHLYAHDILSVIVKLNELENIVRNIELSTKDAEKQLKEVMVKTIDRYGKE